MNIPHHLLVATTLVFTLAGPARAAEGAEPAWPGKVVKIEQLRPLNSVTLKVPGLVVKGGVKGPAVLRVHVNEAGKVVKTALLESCGNADLDEAAMHAARDMVFKPYTVAGVPTEVTLLLPMHVPKRFGRTG
jgi:TonB family protein